MWHRESSPCTSSLFSLCLHFLLCGMGVREVIRNEQLMGRDCLQCYVQPNSEVVSRLSWRVYGNRLAMSALGTRRVVGAYVLCICHPWPRWSWGTQMILEAKTEGHPSHSRSPQSFLFADFGWAVSHAWGLCWDNWADFLPCPPIALPGLVHMVGTRIPRE